METDTIVRVIYPFTHTFIDYPDPESDALSIFFVGCEHRCKHCSNPDLQRVDYVGSIEVSLTSIIEQIYKDSKKYKTNKLCFMGGDPLYTKNIEFVKKLLHLIHTDFDICIYTGYTKDYVIQHNLKGFRFLKCGCYDHNLKQISKKTDDNFQFASTNQKLYDSHFSLLSINGKYRFGEASC